MKLLFITHQTTRTGAPILLLHVLRWLQQHQPHKQVDVLALSTGDLQSQYVNTCSAFYDYEALTKTERLSLFKRILIKLGLKKAINKHQVLQQQLIQQNYDVIYANTIVSVPIGSRIAKGCTKAVFIAHIHELYVIIKQLLPDFNAYLDTIDHIIVPSQLTAKGLIERWGANPKDVSVVYSFSNSGDIPKKTNASKNLFTVGASGTVHWRKGYDVFIQLARYMSTHYPDKDTRFVWVGKLYPLEALIVQEDLRKLGLENVVTFIGEVEEAPTFFNDFDVFVMPSREDPFPLVCVEVGLLGKPMISFEGAVGTNEILESGGGYIVPYLDIESMAEKVVYYRNHPDIRVKHGAINIKQFSKFTSNYQCTELYAVIQNQLKT